LGELGGGRPAPQVIVVGRKGADFVNRLGAAVQIVGVYPSVAEPTVTDIQPIAQTAIRLFREGTIDTVQVLYTDFISAARQEVTRRTLLPLKETSSLVGKIIQETTFEPSPAAVLKYVVPRVLEIQVYQATLEALASEHSMRMVAMKNASDNATELSDDLTLLYNRARQGTITQELAEITAGAEAIT
jgi:F-type H+-transporting ATPase subunit gamma